MEQNAFPKGLQQCPIFSDVFHILLSVYNHTNCLMRCYTNSYSIINPLSWIELMFIHFLCRRYSGVLYPHQHYLGIISQLD